MLDDHFLTRVGQSRVMWMTIFFYQSKSNQGDAG